MNVSKHTLLASASIVELDERLSALAEAMASSRDPVQRRMSANVREARKKLSFVRRLLDEAASGVLS